MDALTRLVYRDTRMKEQSCAAPHHHLKFDEPTSASEPVGVYAHAASASPPFSVGRPLITGVRCAVDFQCSNDQISSKIRV